MKRALKSLWILIALLSFAGILKATLPQVVIGTWTSAATLTQPRSSASAVLLADGRIMFIGGDGTSGPLQSAEFFATDGTVSPAAAMNVARSRHFAVALSDGRVLVGGGTSAGGGTTNSAEIYDPSADSWTQTNPMSEARVNATAALLKDGRVLIAGGDNSGTPSNTIEIFDPVSGNFSFAGTLSSPRIKHAMAVLQDGRVLIVGGSDGNNPLASSDIFDSSSGNVSAGPSLVTARSGHSATTLLDGRVVVIGGSDGSGADLASAELYDPASGGFNSAGAPLATARQGHQAFLLPNNNNVLIVGGTSGGAAVAASELFTPQVSASGVWSSSFAATGANVTPRSAAVGSAMQQDGLLLAAGGNDASGNALASTELYAFPTVKTDQSDYAPGSIVTIAGTGWQPGETVTLTLVESPLIDTHPQLTAVADANGNISNNQFSPDVHDIDVRFYLTALGSQSGLQAQNTFTDASNITSATVTIDESTCTTPTSAFTRGQTICANVNVTGITGSGAGSFFIVWFNPSNTAVQTTTKTVPASVPTGFTDTLSTNGSSPTGAWKVSVCKNSTCNGGGNDVADASFTLASTATRYLVTSSSNTPAAGSAVTITAQLSDAGGNPVPTSGKVITWSSTNGGSFGSPTSTTNASGQATVQFTTSTVAGTVHTVTATDNTSLTGTSANITTQSGTASKLAFGQQPTDTAAGSAISAPGGVTVKIEDANGNVVTSNTSTVSIAISIPGTFSGTSTTSVAAVSGVATFLNLVPTKVGTGFTLSATDGVLTSATSNPFNVTAGALDHFKVEQSGGGAIGTQTAGTPFSIRITAQDLNNNTVTSFTSTVTLTSNGTLAGSPLTSGTFTAGVLDPQSATITSTGAAVTITATGSGKTGVSNAFAVNAGALDHFKVEQGGGGAIGTQTAGTPFNLRITAQDINNNTATSFTSTVTLTSTGTLTGAPLTSGNFTAGVLDPQSVTITSVGASVTITATGSGKTGTSNSFAVTAPDLTATKTNSVSGTTGLGNSWTWSIQVSNIGTSAATFSANNQIILHDDLPNANITYGVPTVGSLTGITNSNQIGCTIAANVLVCVQSGNGNFVSIAPGGSFTVSFTATPSAAGTFANPSSGGTCKVDPNNNVGESNTANNSCADTVTVSAANTSTTITSTIPATSGLVGQPVTVNFQVKNTSGTGVAPTGTVTASDGTTADNCTGVLTAGALGVSTGSCNLTPSTTGAKTLTASYPASANFNASASAGTPYTVNSRSTSTAVICSPSPDNLNTATTCTATVTDTDTGTKTTPGGTVNFSSNGTGNFSNSASCILSTGSCSVTYTPTVLGTGTHRITGTYGGDTTHATSNGFFDLTVNNPATTLSVAAASGTYGGTAMLSATLTTTSGGSPVSGKSISFTLNGNPVGSATTDATGAATIASASLSGINAGTYATGVGASFAGDSTYLASSGSNSLTVSQATATVMLVNLLQPYDGLPKFASAATTPMGLTVVLTYDQGGNPVANPTNAGSYNVTASVQDQNYTGGTTGTLIISPAMPVITWNNPADISYGTALSSTQLNATATFNSNPVSGTFSYNPGAGTVLPAGSGQALVANFTSTDSNFSSVSGTTVHINVKTDPLYVISGDNSRAFGAPDSPLTPTLVGLVSPDTASSIGGLMCNAAATSTSTPGTYAIACSGVTSTNYSVTYINGTLTITNPLIAITSVTDTQGGTIQIGQTDQLTATGKFADNNSRTLASAGGLSFSRADMGTPVSGAAVAEAGGMLYVIGGFDGSNTVNAIQSYNPKTNTWSTISATLGTARTNAAVASAAGRIYVVGGLDAHNNPLASIEVLDTTGGTPAVSAFSGSLSTARSNAAAAVWNQKLYVIGGSTGSAQSTVDVFDLVMGTSSIADAGTAFAQASAAVLNNKLYVVGVSGGAVVAISSSDGTTWSSASATSLNATNGVGIVMFSDPLIYVVNGANVWSYDGTTFMPESNPLGNAHNASQPAAIGSRIYIASIGSGASQSAKLDAFAPDEVNWSSADNTKATIDNFGKATAVATTTPTVTLTATSIANNSINQTFDLTVIKKTQTIHFVLADPHATYGDPDIMISATSVDSSSNPTNLLVSFAAGATDGCTVGASTLLSGTSSAMVHITGAGNCTITASQAGDSTTWQAAAHVVQSFQIAKAALTVTADPQSRFYGDPNPTFTSTISGFKNGEMLASSGVTGAASCSTTATPSSPVSGSPYAITCTLGTLTASNYDFTTFNPSQLTVNKAHLTVTADPQSRFYGDPNPTFTSTISGFKNGEMLASSGVTGAASCSTTATPSSPVSGSPYAITCTVGTLTASNYDFTTFNPGQLTVNKAHLTVTADPQSRFYGDPDPTFTSTISGFKNSEMLGTSGITGMATCTTTAISTSSISPPTYPIICTAGTLTAVNYDFPAGNFISGALTITARPIIVTPTAGQSKVYGYSDPTLIYTITSGNLVAGDAFSGMLSRVSGENVGTYAMTQGTLSAGPNYLLTFTPGITFSITARQITVTADAEAKIFGQIDVVPFTYKVTSGSLAFSDMFSGAVTRDAGENVGMYAIRLGTLGLSGNYNLTFVESTLTISPAMTTTTVTSSLNPSNYGQSVTFTATVTPQYSGTPTGAVAFYIASSGATCSALGTSSLIDGTMLSGGQASVSTSTLPTGALAILACYTSDTTNLLPSNLSFAQSVIPAPVVSLSPTSLSFGNQQAGTTSTQAIITVKNTGTAALNISGTSITGTNANYFAFATPTSGTDCRTVGSVAINASCNLAAVFKPVDTGAATAMVNITDNDKNQSGSVQQVPLTGASVSSINSVASLFSYGIFATANGCGTLTLSGGSSVDSFDSTQGYGASHLNSGGNVGTNGNLTLNGSNVAVYGSASLPMTTTANCSSKSPTGLSTSGGAQVAGGLLQLSQPVVYAAPAMPSPVPPTINQNISGSCGTISGCTNNGSKNVMLAPGQYGNLNASGGTTIHVSIGTYNLNSLTLSGNSILVVDSGPVVINIAGNSLSGGATALDLSGGSMANASGIPSNLQFYYGGSRSVKLSGGAGNFAVVYAPNSPITLSGGSHFFGSIIGSTITLSGGTAMHYDRSLPAIAGGSSIWFNSAAMNVQNLPANATAKVFVTNANITFNGTTYPVPNAVITFSPTASSATTSWDSTNNRWQVLVPRSFVAGNGAVHTFLDGFAFQVPGSGLPNGIQNATWSAAFATDTPGVTFQWQWAAAVYTQFSTTYGSLGVNAVDNADPAGTPENFKSYLTTGGSGAGATNYTGFYVGTAGVVPTMAPASISPSSLNFGSATKNTTSAAMTAVLSNNQSGTLTLNSVTPITITGTNAGDFAQTNNCPATLVGGGGACTITITFTPTATGVRKGKVVVTDDANNSPQTVFLTGTGN